MEKQKRLGAIVKIDSTLGPHVAIIILNWHGWRDTLECLESLQQLDYSNFTTIVIDNASGDESLEKITSWARGEILVESQYLQPRADNKPVAQISMNRAEAEQDACLEQSLRLLDRPSHERLIVIQSDENLGFAAGNNLGIRFAMHLQADYIWLLNNDTVVDRQALSHLVNCMEAQPDLACATGQIRYYDKPIIWNCGGNLTWSGSRKYHFHGVDIAGVPQTGTLPITFITGCALLARSTTYEKWGMLTELFFFGEEDYEFSMRLRRQRQRIICCLDAVIYHKVGSSVKQATPKQVNLWYINYLSRFIDMRSFMPGLAWRIWRHATLLYILPMLKMRYGPSLGTLMKLRRHLLHDSSTLDAVTKQTFERTMHLGFENALA
jgi:GT2 family glycosyltransferase